MNKGFYYIWSDGTLRIATLADLKAAVATPSTPTPPSPKAKFKPGDVVTLNSGSPDMTVVDETNGEVRVIYFPETDSASMTFAAQPVQVIIPAVCLSAIPTDEMN